MRLGGHVNVTIVDRNLTLQDSYGWIRLHGAPVPARCNPLKYAERLCWTFGYKRSGGWSKNTVGSQTWSACCFRPEVRTLQCP